MSTFTYADAINAGLKTELMTVATDDEVSEDTDTPPPEPTVLSGSYKLGTTQGDDEKFNGYAFEMIQDPLVAESISGEFVDTENFLEFAKDLKDSGATLQLDGIIGTYTAQQAIDAKLIYDVRSSTTTIEGNFEISEGVIKIFQNSFTFADGSSGAFATADDLIEFVEKCLEDLRMFDQVKRMWMRKPYRYLERFSGIARLSNRIDKFGN